MIPENRTVFNITLRWIICRNHTNFDLFKLKFNFRLLVLTHTKSTIALYHNSLIRIANPSIPHSFLSTATQTHFAPHHSFSPFPFIFVSVTANKSNLPFLNTFITSLLISSTFIPLTFHIQIRFIHFRRRVEGGLLRSRPSPRHALAFLAKDKR